MAAKEGSLRKLVDGKKPVLSMGIWDCLTAKIAERSGFDVGEIGSYQLSATLLGKLDIGLDTMTEMVTATRNIAKSVSIPVFSDAEQGYGTPIHMIRTVQELESAGGQGVMFDDKVMETCPWLPDKSIVARYWRGVIPKEEMVAKVKAAAYARSSDDFVIKFRSNVRGPGMEGPIGPALERCRLAIKAGADMLRIGVNSVEEIRMWDKLGVPLEVTVSNSRFMDGKSFEEISALGDNVRIINITTIILRALARNLLEVMSGVTREGSGRSLIKKDMPVKEWMELLGVRELSGEIEKFMPPTQKLIE